MKRKRWFCSLKQACINEIEKCRLDIKAIKKAFKVDCVQRYFPYYKRHLKMKSICYTTTGAGVNLKKNSEGL